MSRPLVKICGITRLEDARFCAGAMVDRLGFIFTPQSPRVVEEGLAGAIVNWIQGVETVGVFMNQDPEWINGVMRRNGLDRVQLHGDEHPEQISRLHHPVIKAIPVTSGMSAADLQARVDLYAPHVDEFLFDHRIERGTETVHGGTGIPFDWRVLAGVTVPKPWFLAGGLSASNVAEAWQVLKPAGFDLSSGVEVEQSPGRKDSDKILAFMEAVEQLE
jgi:phosphoribosylanthranilate isomerase